MWRCSIASNRRSGVDARLRQWLDAAAGHYEAGRLAQAAELYGQAERAAPKDLRAAYSLALIHLRQGAPEEARHRLVRFTRHQPAHFGAWHNLAAALEELGDWEGAADAYARALGLRGDADQTRFGLARALTALGRATEAIEAYRILAAVPSSRNRALVRLAILAPGAVTDEELALLGRSDPDAEILSRIERLFALGTVLETRADAEGAFAAFELANGIKHASLVSGPFRARPAVVEQRHEDAACFLRNRFTAEFLNSQTMGRQDAAPIFVVGMPRSGSSLIEQILASHPEVQGMGETPALSSILDDRYPYAPGREPEADHFSCLADRYLARMRTGGWRDRLRLVDKTLENYLHIGMIHLMFPRGVILHCVRDPVDTCLACYRQLFTVGAETLYDLGQIGTE